jgi:hypothetical protein
LVLTFCINSTKGRGGGHEPPRLIEALGKETGEPTGIEKGVVERETFITKLGEGRKR